MPQDRLRKFTEDNKQLAIDLKRELTQPPPPKSTSKAVGTNKHRKGQGSDLGSGRGSEERHSSVPTGGRGTKRGRDNDIEKVCVVFHTNIAVSAFVDFCCFAFAKDNNLNFSPTTQQEQPRVTLVT